MGGRKGVEGVVVGSGRTGNALRGKISRQLGAQRVGRPMFAGSRNFPLHAQPDRRGGTSCGGPRVLAPDRVHSTVHCVDAVLQGVAGWFGCYGALE